MAERHRAAVGVELRELETGFVQREIAGRVGISQMQVSRLIRRELERLRVVAGATTA